MNPDGSGREVYARGVRNSVGMAFDPVGGALWFTDNGRDMLGDNLPSDEVNRATGADSTSDSRIATRGTCLIQSSGRASPAPLTCRRW